MALKHIADIVKGLVDKLDHDFIITTNTDMGGGVHKLFTTNTYYLTELKVIEIAGLNYRVTELKFNEYVVVEPVGHTTSIIVDSFNLPAPDFFHGTVKTVDNEVQLFMEQNPNKYPIVYLFRYITERIPLDPVSPGNRESPVRLFILDQSNYDDYLNEDFKEKVEKPLMNVEAKLFEVIKKDTGIGRLSGFYDRTDLTRFARFTNDGNIELVFSENLTALDLNIPLRIKESCE